jgi:hypothetical protein
MKSSFGFKPWFCYCCQSHNGEIIKAASKKLFNIDVAIGEAQATFGFVW